MRKSNGDRTGNVHFPPPQWKANFTIFKDKQLKLETNRRGGHTFGVQLYTGNGFSSSVRRGGSSARG